MKYNKGDKFVIEIEQKIEEAGLYKIKGFKSLVFDDYGLNQIGQMVRGVDQFAYNKGLADAWKIATMIYKSAYHGGLKGFEVKKYFGCTIDEIHKLPIQEVVKGFKHYEEDQNLDWSKVPVDTPILVRENDKNPWLKRHFAKYEDGKVYTWRFGRTSHTSHKGDTVDWNQAKLAE